jgi:VWFA-related protein
MARFSNELNRRAAAGGVFCDVGVRKAYSTPCSTLAAPGLVLARCAVLDVTRVGSVVLLVLLAQSSQQTPPSQQPQPPRFRGGTNLVRVDAFATKGGVPVQNLTAADFELFEDNAPQTIDSFEHVVIEAAGPGARVNPESVSRANQLAADPHRRVFVIYLDIEHVDMGGSHDIKEPLIGLMNRVMGADDLVGVMTPEMSPDQITFGRRTEVIEEGLRRNWAWGRRDTIIPDDREILYQNCFPPANSVDSIPSHLAKQMTLRRREKMVLDSLYDLSRHMAAIREGRTAVITVSPGWVLYKPDPSMTIPRKTDNGNNADPLPGSPRPVGVGGGGTLMMRPNPGPNSTDQTECDKERFDLANLDDEVYLRNLFGEANRANVSFYTIDPRGLVVFDSAIGPDPPPTILQDYANLKTRHESLATLAINTDGLALENSNNLHGQLRRIADDLTSYYLIGYYSTNTKLDGRFRTIKVRSKRPGIEIRARRGYKAASAADVKNATAAADAPVPEAKAALSRALGTIESDARAQGRPIARGAGEPLIFHRGPSTGNQMQPAAGRVFPRSDRVHLEMEAAAGAAVWTGVLLDRNGAKTAVPVTVGERSDTASSQRFLTADITLAPLGPGDYVVELTATQGAEQKRTLVALRVTP